MITNHRQIFNTQFPDVQNIAQRSRREQIISELQANLQHLNAFRVTPQEIKDTVRNFTRDPKSSLNKERMTELVFEFLQSMYSQQWEAFSGTANNDDLAWDVKQLYGLSTFAPYLLAWRDEIIAATQTPPLPKPSPAVTIESSWGLTGIHDGQGANHRVQIYNPFLDIATWVPDPEPDVDEVATP